MELLRALGVLSELPGREHARLAQLLGLEGPLARAEHTSLFVLELPPYASVYLGDEGALGGEVRDRVAGFWGALGDLPPSEPDHLAALLGLYTVLGSRETEVDARGASQLHRARRALFWEHVSCWVPAYLSRVVELASPAYQSWARLLAAALAEEAAHLGEPTVVPLHFREAGPATPDEPDTLDELVGALVAPVRSGILLTRADLAVLADALGAGARMSSRRSALASMIAQGGDAAIAWLAQEAARQAALHAGWPQSLAPVRDFWQERAAHTAGVLEALRGRGT
jgi:TorA maturation chaperone TorD